MFGVGAEKREVLRQTSDKADIILITPSVSRIIPAVAYCSECVTIRAYTDEDWNDEAKQKSAQQHLEKVHGLLK